MKKENKHFGSNFDDFLKEEGQYEVTEATAIKRVIAYQLAQTMETLHLTKSQMAAKMHTSRSAVERLFDSENASVTLVTLNKAASVLGKRLKFELV